MTPAFRIRPALLPDAPEIARLSGELGYPSTPAAITGRLARMVEDPRYVVLVAVEPGAAGLLGWITAEERLSLETGALFEVTGLVVGMTARRRGVGARLVGACEAWAWQRGARRLRVRSNAAREESHAFYEALGFVRRKTQHAYEKDVTGI